MAAIVIEIADECNRSVLFHPNQMKLRGRWDSQRVSYKRPHPALAKLPPIIPGIQIRVDIQKKLTGIFDPLSLPENAHIINAIKDARQEVSGISPGHDPWPAINRKDCADTEIKTWLYWMRRLVDEGQAVIVGPEDSLPTLEQLEALKGDIHISQFNVLATRPYRKGEENEPSAIANQKANA